VEPPDVARRVRPNKALQPTVLPPLRCGKTSAELGRWAWSLFEWRQTNRVQYGNIKNMKEKLMELIGVAKMRKSYNTVVCLLLFMTSIVGCKHIPPVPPPIPPARHQITIEGEGKEVIRTTAGPGTCLNAYTTVDVGVSIAGGTAGNTITGNAFCGGNPGASASVTDTGGAGNAKKATGTIIPATVATCTHVYTGIPDSHWLVTCDFY